MALKRMPTEKQDIEKSETDCINTQYFNFTTLSICVELVLYINLRIVRLRRHPHHLFQIHS